MGCIYKITNKYNNKSYIGQTKRSLNVRIKEHYRDAYRPKSGMYSSLFHKAIRKYGSEAFESSVLEFCNDEELNDREQYWIKYYNTFPNGYNMNYGGDFIGSHHLNYEEIYQAKILYHMNALELANYFHCSTATIQNALKSQGLSKQKIAQISASKRNQAVYGYNPDIKQIQYFPSKAEAARITQVNRANINKALKGEIEAAGGYLWAIDQQSLEKKIKKLTKIRPLTHQIKIDQYSLDGKYIATYNSQKEALEAVGRTSNSGGISNNLHGRAKSAYGFIWKYNNGE